MSIEISKIDSWTYATFYKHQVDLAELQRTLTDIAQEHGCKTNKFYCWPFMNFIERTSGMQPCVVQIGLLDGKLACHWDLLSRFIAVQILNN